VITVTSPIPLPAQPAQSLLAAASGGRILPALENFRTSELAPVMTTTLSLIPGMKFRVSPIQRCLCALLSFFEQCELRTNAR